jgi:hypothetical protein
LSCEESQEEGSSQQRALAVQETRPTRVVADMQAPDEKSRLGLQEW